MTSFASSHTTLSSMPTLLCPCRARGFGIHDPLGSGAAQQAPMSLYELPMYIAALGGGMGFVRSRIFGKANSPVDAMRKAEAWLYKK